MSATLRISPRTIVGAISQPLLPKRNLVAAASRSMIAFALSCHATSHAHDPGLSSATITIEQTRVVLQLQYAPADIESIAAADGEEPGVGEAIEWKARGAAVRPTQVESLAHGRDNVEFFYVFPRSDDLVQFRSRLLQRLPLAHRQLVTVQKEGALLFSKMMSGQDDMVEIDLAPRRSEADKGPRRKLTAAAFVSLGVEHILTGYDHLLFLFALLLVCRRFQEAVTIITGFTVAHSLTLGLATFGIVEIPGRIVEPVIAASIVYVGLENLWAKVRLRGRLLLTFAFGLVHGLGFAGALREVGIGAGESGVAIPLFSFNLGVELGQIGVAAVVFPLLLQLRRKAAFVRVGLPVCSMTVALAGGYWLLERTVL